MRLTMFAAAVAAAFAAVAPASAAEKLAIVLLHGGGSSGSQFNDMVPVIEKAGYRILTPDSCWAQSRQYDASAQDCLADVDKSVNRLKAEGFQKIVIAGHSRGGIFAIYYAANRAGLAGVVAFAPSGPPTGMDSNSTAVRNAHQMIKDGKGDQLVNWSSGINEQWATSNVYLSWTGMESPLYDLELLPKLTAPILWVAGTLDPGQRNAAERYKYAPANPLNELVTVEADHFATPDVAVYEMVRWLDKLAGAKPSG